MTIPDCQIPKHLATDSRNRIEVVYPAGGLAFTAEPAVIRLLCQHHMVNGEVNRRGYLKYVRLLVSAVPHDACGRPPRFNSSRT